MIGVMTNDLDVLVIESRPRIAAVAVRALEAAGHRVHRCYDDPDAAGPCRGLASPPDCPVDGSVDVALVVRPGHSEAPAHFEEGVSCAVRAHVPVVELGADEAEPFRPWITTRVPEGGDVAEACADAIAESFTPVRAEVQGRIARLLRTYSIEMTDVAIRFEPRRGGLDVHLDLPVAVPRGVEQALAVRVLDALRGSGRTFGRVDVHVHGA
jgi:hypothetical protein